MYDSRCNESSHCDRSKVSKDAIIEGDNDDEQRAISNFVQTIVLQVGHGIADSFGEHD